MNESQHFGVEAETVDRRGLVAVTVLAVTDYRTTLARKMNANLIGTTGLEVQFDEGELAVSCWLLAVGYWRRYFQRLVIGNGEVTSVIYR